MKHHDVNTCIYVLFFVNVDFLTSFKRAEMTKHSVNETIIMNLIYGSENEKVRLTSAEQQLFVAP